MRPDEFPLGSAQSRAAARGVLESRKIDAPRLEVINHIPRPNRDGQRDDTKPYAAPWQKIANGQLMRILYVPTGMTEEEARRAVGT
jgi:hypothetical protein